MSILGSEWTSARSRGASRSPRIQLHGPYRRHVLLEDSISLDDDNHTVRLAEDEHAVLRNDAGRGVLLVHSCYPATPLHHRRLRSRSTISY